MSERFKELVLKTSDAATYQGFESLSLRHKKALKASAFKAFLLLILPVPSLPAVRRRCGSYAPAGDGRRFSPQRALSVQPGQAEQFLPESQRFLLRGFGLCRLGLFDCRGFDDKLYRHHIGVLIGNERHGFTVSAADG